ncbi:MAG TPA: MFS transporter [Gaiellaceae bacterium]|nr:MFS transporter [Gaiellaceae bacterium]
MSEAPLRRNRDFLLLQSGQLLSTFGSGMSTVAYPLLTLAVTHSASRAGYVGAALFAPLVVVGLPAGVAADRVDRRRLMIASDAAGAAAVGSLAFAIATDAISFWLILVVAFVDSSAAVVFRAGQSGAFRAVVPRSQLAAAASAAQARQATVRLAAPPAGGALFGIARFVPFLADACSYAFSTASLLAMRTRFQEERAPRAERPRLREGLAYFGRMPFLRATIGMIAVSNFTFSALQLTVIVLAKRNGLSGTAVGGFVALTGASTLLGSFASPLLRRLLPLRTILLSEFWSALAYGAFLVEPNVYVLAAALAVQAFFFPNSDSALTAYAYVLIPDRLLGRAMAASNTLRAAAAPLGPLAAGLLLTATSARTTVAVAMSATLVTAAVGTASNAIRQAPARLEDVAPAPG